MCKAATVHMEMSLDYDGFMGKVVKFRFVATGNSKISPVSINSLRNILYIYI
jgi:hypothetical protein